MKALPFCGAISAVVLILFALEISPSVQAAPPQQRFVCNTGYTLAECHAQMQVLRKALAKYPVEALGEWTWVLVRSQDWKPILLDRGLDADCPAFTYLVKRETFIEEALVTPIPARAAELLTRWNMSLDRLLDFAIAHEMGHALCYVKDEAKANRTARALQEGKAVACEALFTKTREPDLENPRETKHPPASSLRSALSVPNP